MRQPNAARDMTQHIWSGESIRQVDVFQFTGRETTPFVKASRHEVKEKTS